jgi:hypothetical protein
LAMVYPSNVQRSGAKMTRAGCGIHCLPINGAQCILF